MTEPFITEPCAFPDLAESVYFADPVVGGSFSNSMAKDILPPSCPALFRWKQDHPEPPTAAMELGSAVHTMVLGVGPCIVDIDATSWSIKGAKAAAEEARRNGRIPLLVKDYERAQTMAAKVKADPVAAAFLALDGDPETSIFWRDEPTGIMRRARIDKPSRRVLADLKTTSATGDPFAFGRDAVAKYGYCQQAATYLEGAKALGLCDDDAGFVFVVVSSAPPHLVSVVELTADYLDLGRRLNRYAVDLYARCVERDEWPGFASDVTLVGPPAWLPYHVRDLEAQELSA